MSKKTFSAEQLNLMRKSLTMMELAQHVRDTNAAGAPSGWKIAANFAAPYQWTGGFFSRIYEREGPVPAGEPRYVVAFRGTANLGDMKNLDADKDIVLRRLPAQHDQGVAFVKSFCEKNNIKAEEMAFTGHSLGGYLAITVGMHLGVHKTWVFNSPGPTRNLRDELSNKIPDISKAPCKGLVQVRSIYDVISRWQYPEGNLLDLETTGHHHSLSSLRESIEAALSGKSLKIVPFKRSIASFFNEVSKRLSQSDVAGEIIDRLFGRAGPPPPPPQCKCG